MQASTNLFRGYLSLYLLCKNKNNRFKKDKSGKLENTPKPKSENHQKESFFVVLDKYIYFYGLKYGQRFIVPNVFPKGDTHISQGIKLFWVKAFTGNLWLEMVLSLR